MLEIYVVTGFVLTFLCVVGFAVYALMWGSERVSFGPQDPDAIKFAKGAVGCLIAIPLVWTWPLTVPLGVLYLITRLVKDAFPSGLNKNQLN